MKYTLVLVFIISAMGHQAKAKFLWPGDDGYPLDLSPPKQSSLDYDVRKDVWRGFKKRCATCHETAFSQWGGIVANAPAIYDRLLATPLPKDDSAFNAVQKIFPMPPTWSFVSGEPSTDSVTPENVAECLDLELKQEMLNAVALILGIAKPGQVSIPESHKGKDCTF